MNVRRCSWLNPIGLASSVVSSGEQSSDERQTTGRAREGVIVEIVETGEQVEWSQLTSCGRIGA
jgi:hypothetical protein